MVGLTCKWLRLISWHEQKHYELQTKMEKKRQSANQMHPCNGFLLLDVTLCVLTLASSLYLLQPPRKTGALETSQQLLISLKHFSVFLWLASGVASLHPLYYHSPFICWSYTSHSLLSFQSLLPDSSPVHYRWPPNSNLQFLLALPSHLQQEHEHIFYNFCFHGRVNPVVTQGC